MMMSNGEKVGFKETVNGVRVHLYPFEQVLRPRGSLQKESLSLEILEKLRGYYGSWTDPKYGDSVDEWCAVHELWDNLHDEMIIAWREFLDELGVDGGALGSEPLRESEK